MNKCVDCQKETRGRGKRCRSCSRLALPRKEIVAKVCDVESCDKPLHSKHYCAMHFSRVERTGSIEGQQAELCVLCKTGLARSKKSLYCALCRKQLDKERQQANRERINERRRQDYIKDYRANPSKYLVANSNYVAKKKSNGREPYTREEIFVRDALKCHLCQELVDLTLKKPHPMSASVDHLVPVSLGGPDTKNNVKTAHLRCNIQRGTKALDNTI